MSIKEFFQQMLSAASGRISSKRVCGVIGWIILLATYITCAVQAQEVPSITDSFLIAIVALLGVDSVANIFKK